MGTEWQWGRVGTQREEPRLGTSYLPLPARETLASYFSLRLSL